MNDQNRHEETESFEIDMSKAVDEFADLEKSLALQIKDALGEQVEIEPKSEPKMKKNGFRRIPLWIKIPVLSLLGLILVIGLVVNAMMDRVIVEFDDERMEEQFEEDENTDNLVEVKPEDIILENTENMKYNEDVVNILLVGEEAIGMGSSRGRTDSIMIASVNFKNGELKLISLMRDMYVQIPGYKDNKLNAAYGSGGIPLLEETIELNFGIQIDGSVLVNFDGFQTIIDSLGGVELSLTSDEAYYLNTTNYISDPNNRNVKAGKQTLNGNQALGYMRIRYVRTAEGKADDFGRTSRQRTLLMAIFEKYKSASLTDLLTMVNNLLPYVQTDISKTDIIDYATNLVTMGMGELETMRIPEDDMYDPVYVREMSVLVPHLPETVASLHDFIYGSNESENP